MRLLIIFSLALAGASPVLAADPETNAVRVRHVTFADLNLASDSGRATLRHRTDRAIGEVCGDVEHSNLYDWASVGACKRAARASVNRQMTVAVANAITNQFRDETTLAAR